MIEYLDDFQILLALQRQDHISRAEPRVDSTVEEFGAELFADLVSGRVEPIGSGGEAEVVEANISFLPDVE